jgi:tellurite resistance protein TehA-like permease
MNETIFDYLLNMSFIDYLNILASITIVISFVVGGSYIIYHFFYFRRKEMEVDNEMINKITSDSIIHN